MTFIQFIWHVCALLFDVIIQATSRPTYSSRVFAQYCHTYSLSLYLLVMNLGLITSRILPLALPSHHKKQNQTPTYFKISQISPFSTSVRWLTTLSDKTVPSAESRVSLSLLFCTEMAWTVGVLLSCVCFTSSILSIRYQAMFWCCNGRSSSQHSIKLFPLLAVLAVRFFHRWLLAWSCTVSHSHNYVWALELKHCAGV